MSLNRLAFATALAGLYLLRERRARRNAERLAGALFETLLFAVDANDDETGRHVRRVARFALLLAESSGLGKRDVRDVERVALFHDIGKIHEALLDVLRDAGTLTAEQKEAIATHPSRGADVLAPLDAFYPNLSAGVLAHHERWDGTGYPRKLRGTTIPLISRIVAIADTFDVVTHGRGYSIKRSIEEACSVLQEGRGTQFDPALIDLFLSDDVFARVRRLVRENRVLARREGAERRRGRKESVPDVTFRWRSEAPGRQRQGLAHQVRRG